MKWIVVLVLTLTQSALADSNAELVALQSEIGADVEAGLPLVVQVHVPLCDNNIIRCGGGGLGDGDNLGRNLYWATSGGFVGWFGRRGSGWKLVHRQADPHTDVLEVRVWKRAFKATKAFLGSKASGKRFDAYVVAYAWRGSAIRKAMDAYTVDLYGGDARELELDDGTRLQAGGKSAVVAFVGHNGWMDVADYDFDKVAKAASIKSARRKGAIAVACITEDYLAADVVTPARVPLLFTRWLLFAGAHSFEGAVSALASGKNLAGIRRQAVRNYANGQGKKASRVSGAFTNPSDKRWKNL